eukprot:scaffold2986_cov123-Isochrysis_galbana.AAC.3
MGQSQASASLASRSLYHDGQWRLAPQQRATSSLMKRSTRLLSCLARSGPVQIRQRVAATDEKSSTRVRLRACARTCPKQRTPDPPCV